MKQCLWGVLALLVTSLLLLGGCSDSKSPLIGGGPAAGGERGGLTFSVNWPQAGGSRIIPESTTKISVTVTQADTTLATRELVRQAGQATGTVTIDDLPTGPVTVVAKAVDATDQVVAQSGEVPVTIKANIMNQANIELFVLPGKLGLWRWDSSTAYALDAASGQLTQIGNTSNCAFLHPNGQQMLVMTAMGGTHLDLLNLDGSLQTRVYSNPELAVWYFAYSDDGSKIAFSACSNVTNVWNVYLIDADGSNLRQLTHFTPEDNVPGVYSVRISPDNQTVVFERPTSDFSSMSLWKVNADGTGLTLFTNGNPSTYFPVFSPDGTKLVFSDQEDLYMVNASNGTGKVRLASIPGFQSPAAFSPDGNWLAYNSGENWNQCDLYVMKLDGTRRIRLTNMPGMMCKSWAQ